MTLRTFVERIEGGKINNLIYSENASEGFISVWKHAKTFILTWEECPAGEQYDESTYTRDERHPFATLEELLEFLSINELQVDSFVP